MKRIRGILIPIGGAEDRLYNEPTYKEEINPNFRRGDIIGSIWKQCPANSLVTVITTASPSPEETAENYQLAFSLAGCSNVETLHIRNTREADSAKNLKLLAQSKAFFFTGGDQRKILKAFLRTKFLSNLKTRFINEPIVVAGTSAGAMALPKSVIFTGAREEGVHKGQVELVEGLGFIEGVIIDTHFDSRQRFGRLAQASLMKKSLGIGISEPTGILIRQNTVAEVIGAGEVVVIDPRRVTHSNLHEIEHGEPLSAKNLIVHIVAGQDHFKIPHPKQYVPGL